MLFSILSHFDHRYGPKILVSIPKLPPSINLDYIPSLMDLYKEGFFITEYESIKTANLIFEVYSRFARGRREFLMLTLITFEEEYNLNLSSFREIMEYFVNEFKNIKDLHVGLHYQDIPEADAKYQEINDFMFSFSNSLPDERAVYKQNLAKILTYGISQSGTNTIIKSLQEKISQFKSLGEIHDRSFL
jgi:hypothetical protein